MKNLRQRMIEDMTLRGLSARTQETYLDAIKALARHFSRCPEELTESQIRDYLVYLQQVRKLARSTLKVRVSALRFLYQKTLGRSEREILDNLNVVIPQIIRYERKVRTTLFNEHRPQVEDRVWRAYGLLTNARVMSSDEAMHLLSQIRLGATLGILTTVDMAAVNRLFILTRPAHLQKMTDRELDAQERDRMRAEFLRQAISGEAPSGPNDPIQ